MSKLDDIISGTVPQDADLREAFSDLKSLIDALDARLDALPSQVNVYPASQIDAALKAAGIESPFAINLGG